MPELTGPSDTVLLDGILSASPLGVVVADPDGRIVRANDCAWDILELEDEDDLASFSLAAWGIRDAEGRDVEPAEHPFRLACERREAAHGRRCTVTTAAGRRRHLSISSTPLTDDDGALAGVMLVLEDVSRHVAASAALRESEARVRAVLETTVDGIITIDARGVIESFNDAAERIFGYEADEVIGQNVSVLMPQPYREEHDSYVHSYLDTGRRRIIGIGREVVGLRKDGSTFPMDLAVSEVQVDERRIFTGIVRDITERRWLEQELLRTSEQERRRIGQDLHDGLGQMLTGIGLIAQNVTRRMKAEGNDAYEHLAEITDLIREADQYARGLARGLIPVELESNGLAEAIRRLVANAERLFGITCTFEAVGSALIYDSNVASHLYRIAQEAVSNAVKHGKAAGVNVVLAAGERQIRLRVQDDGVGFPEKLPEERGMGVRIMHYRARIIGATLDIRANPDAGTTVTCTLPRQQRVPLAEVGPPA